MIWGVLDTNVLVSGLGWRSGASAKILDRALAGQFVLVTSEPLLAELQRLLDYPKLSRVFREPAGPVALIKEISIVVVTETQLSVLEDEFDNRVLEAAVTARADVIVSGDRDILSLAPAYEETRILRPAEFLTELLRQEHHQP